MTDNPQLSSDAIFGILRDEIPLETASCGCGDERTHAALIEQHNSVVQAFSIALMEASDGR